jgi:ketosteroid isomerase-like protein
MATGNDELVRSSFDAFLRGDWEALSRFMDPEVEWLWYEPGDWDCHDRKKVLATLFDRQREGFVTGLNHVVAVDERVFVEVTGPRLEQWGLPDGQACMVVAPRDARAGADGFGGTSQRLLGCCDVRRSLRPALP